MSPRRRRPVPAAAAGCVLVLTAALTACGKTDAVASRKADQSPVAGAQAAYTAKGWKPGDATSWEEHMRTRAQAQNEYSKTR